MNHSEKFDNILFELIFMFIKYS